MPELPEVQTTVNGLQSKVLNRTFVDVWSDWEKMACLRSQVNLPKDFSVFKKELQGKKIKRIWRRAKNIILELSDGYSLLIHQKMTGHVMVGKWKLIENEWKAEEDTLLSHKVNSYVHIMFSFDNGLMMAMSDYRKFAKVELWKTNELLTSKVFLSLGPEPLEDAFTYKIFKERLHNKRGKIKQVLMKPEVIAGIGNIYASEALWWAKIHPEKETHKLTERELKLLFPAIKKVLTQGVELGGESFSDYRNVDGDIGGFHGRRRVYKRESMPCYRCKTPIKRLMFGGRSAFYCPKCQKL